jgi:ferritin
MRVQEQEEKFHALKFNDYIVERGGRVTLQAIEAPPTEWSSPLDAFEATLTHEQKVTGLINDLVFLARDERDNAAEIFLQWFVTEQVEEEANDNEIISKLKLVGEKGSGLFMVDRELAARKKEEES